MKEFTLLPFLKWPGGKRWLITKYSSYFQLNFRLYIEPFLGGGAAFFYVNPQKAILSDINNELITLYKVMRDNPKKLAQAMKTHQAKHNHEYFYYIRDTQPDNQIDIASRLLYLNRTCYNGMFRVNKAGRFNVPIGTKNNCISDIDLFSEYSDRLKSAEINSSDFAEVIRRSGKGDFIFADPPYTISHNQNSFIKYNEKLFSWEDQKRLLNELILARTRGSVIIATNANYSKLRSMYEDCGFYIKVLERMSVMSGKTEKRRKQKELLISSKPLDLFDGGTF